MSNDRPTPPWAYLDSPEQRAKREELNQWAEQFAQTDPHLKGLREQAARRNRTQGAAAETVRVPAPAAPGSAPSQVLEQLRPIAAAMPVAPAPPINSVRQAAPAAPAAPIARPIATTAPTTSAAMAVAPAEPPEPIATPAAPTAERATPVAQDAPSSGANVISIEDAARQVRRQQRHDPPPKEARGGIPPGKWKPGDAWGLPPNCPVTPLGVEGGSFHLVDADGQFRTLKAAEFTVPGVQSLFAGTPNYPKWAWPKYENRGGKSMLGKGFDVVEVRETLFQACAAKGFFSPDDQMRGRGAWKLRGGALIYHAGARIWTVRQGRFAELPTGMHEGLLYPRLAALPDPWTAPITPAEHRRSVGALLETLRRWNRERPAIDPVLLLGWIGVAYLGGALDWRSALLLLGDKGTGKSTLQYLLQMLFGAALFHSADTTAAGIYQRMAHDARPVALDELENGADPRKVANVVQLMRDASSGAMGRRGSSDGTAAEFQMRSAFLFSAINNPVQSSQDLSRIAILRLREIERDKDPSPAIDQEITGRICLARLMLEWPRFASTFETFAAALKAGGHSGRGADTYGTLLTCAELLLGPELAAELEVPLSEDTHHWRAALAADQLPEIEDAQSNWRACITHLLTVQVMTWRVGGATTIGTLLHNFRARTKDKLPLDDELKEVREALAAAGLGLELAHKITDVAGEIGEAKATGLLLAVPNSSALVGQLFRGTQWQGAPGAGGAWKDALHQAPPEIVIRAKSRCYIGGVQQRCSLIVLAKI